MEQLKDLFNDSDEERSLAERGGRIKRKGRKGRKRKIVEAVAADPYADPVASTSNHGAQSSTRPPDKMEEDTPDSTPQIPQAASPVFATADPKKQIEMDWVHEESESEIPANTLPQNMPVNDQPREPIKNVLKTDRVESCPAPVEREFEISMDNMSEGVELFPGDSERVQEDSFKHQNERQSVELEQVEADTSSDGATAPLLQTSEPERAINGPVLEVNEGVVTSPGTDVQDEMLEDSLLESIEQFAEDSVPNRYVI